jgi:broad specificity phosphatase PhoE
MNGRGTQEGLPLLFVRHGETTWNRDGRYQGQSDPPLSPAGQAAVAALGQRLAALPVVRLIASPLRRAMMTADCLANIFGLPVEVDKRLIELGFGAWEGRTQAEVKAVWPDLLRRWKHSPETMQFPGGESLATVQARLSSFLHALPRPQAGMIALVTHDAIIRTAILAAEGMKLSAFRTLRIPTASAHHLTWIGGTLEVGLADARCAVGGTMTGAEIGGNWP